MKMVTTKELELCEKKVGVVPPADKIAKSREKAGPRGCGDGEVGQDRGAHSHLECYLTFDKKNVKLTHNSTPSGKILGKI